MLFPFEAILPMRNSTKEHIETKTKKREKTVKAYIEAKKKRIPKHPMVERWKHTINDNDKENMKPLKKKRLSLALPNKRRFGNVSIDKLDKMTTYVMPKNSAASSEWALENLKEWCSGYNSRYHDMCPQEILIPYCSKENLNKWLSTFAVKTRNHQGKPYPPKTIYSYLCGILHEMRNTNPVLNKEDSEISTFHTTLDNLLKSLRNDGFIIQQILIMQVMCLPNSSFLILNWKA